MPACECFQAAVIPAGAQRTVLFHSEVSDLSCRAGVAIVKLLIDDESCSNTTAHLDEGKIFFAAAGSIGPLAQGAQFSASKVKRLRYAYDIATDRKSVV